MSNSKFASKLNEFENLVAVLEYLENTQVEKHYPNLHGVNLERFVVPLFMNSNETHFERTEAMKFVREEINSLRKELISMSK